MFVFDIFQVVIQDQSQSAESSTQPTPDPSAESPSRPVTMETEVQPESVVAEPVPMLAKSDTAEPVSMSDACVASPGRTVVMSGVPNVDSHGKAPKKLTNPNVSQQSSSLQRLTLSDLINKLKERYGYFRDSTFCVYPIIHQDGGQYRGPFDSVFFATVGCAKGLSGPYAQKSKTGSKITPGLSEIYFCQKGTFICFVTS